MAETFSAVSPCLAATSDLVHPGRVIHGDRRVTPAVAAWCRYLRVDPDFVVFEELPVSDPVDPLVEPAVPDPLVEPELVVSDGLPVVPLPVVPLEPEPLMPVVPPLVEPGPVLPLPIVLPLPVVPDVEPDP